MSMTTLGRVTTAGGNAEVGTGGKRKIVYGVHLAAGAGAAGRAIFHNSTTNNNPLIELAAISGGGDGQEFEGAIFDKGCFVEISGAGAGAAVEFVEQG